ncbi:MAG: zf-TFIIB domain-containing protein [Deltaproteobacteria bacterium]|nr:zf-TFIIB domain-containing protein [Deltaproteobacteria bacterium]
MSPYNRSSKEEEYFAKQEAEKLRQSALEHAAEMAEEEKKRQKELHYMKCPKCGMDMKEIEFRNVHIDKCFSCGGLYFDDGELEQVIADEGEDSFLGRITSFFK